MYVSNTTGFYDSTNGIIKVSFNLQNSDSDTTPITGGTIYAILDNSCSQAIYNVNTWQAYFASTVEDSIIVCGASDGVNGEYTYDTTNAKYTKTGSNYYIAYDSGWKLKSSSETLYSAMDSTTTLPCEMQSGSAIIRLIRKKSSIDETITRKFSVIDDDANTINISTWTSFSFAGTPTTDVNIKMAEGKLQTSSNLYKTVFFDYVADHTIYYGTESSQGKSTSTFAGTYYIDINRDIDDTDVNQNIKGQFLRDIIRNSINNQSLEYFYTDSITVRVLEDGSYSTNTIPMCWFPYEILSGGSPISTLKIKSEQEVNGKSKIIYTNYKENEETHKILANYRFRFYYKNSETPLENQAFFFNVDDINGQSGILEKFCVANSSIFQDTAQGYDKNYVTYPIIYPHTETNTVESEEITTTINLGDILSYNAQDNYFALKLDWGNRLQLQPQGYKIDVLNTSGYWPSCNGTYYKMTLQEIKFADIINPESTTVYNKLRRYYDDNYINNYPNTQGMYRIYKKVKTANEIQDDPYDYYILRRHEYNSDSYQYKWVIARIKLKNNGDLDERYKSNCIIWESNNDINNENKNLSQVLIYDNYYTTTYIAAESPHGKSKEFYFKAKDKCGNITDVNNTTLQVYRTNPYDTFIKIVGSSGSENYTGFFERNGRFIPSDYATVYFSGRSKVRLWYRIYGDNLVSPMGDDEWLELKDSSKNYSHAIRLKPVNPNYLLLGNDQLCTISIDFIDEAGNNTTVSSKIKYISRIFRTENQNLVNDYESPIFYAVSGASLEKLTENRISRTEYKRSWNEIYYPPEHGNPTNLDGSINETQALRIANLSDDSEELLLYDKLSLSGGELQKDAQGRFIQGTWSETKKYSSNINKMGVNSTDNDFLYWIIDNTGNPDFQLEFERFDLDTNITKIPANYSSPYEGDVLVVYDASAPSCVSETLDDNGYTKYVLNDSTLLKQLFALKCTQGTNGKQFVILGDEAVGNLTTTGNGFVTPPILSTSRICLMLFTDAKDVASGFKLKAGPKHALEYSNYDINYKLGEIWVHNSPSSADGTWKTYTDIRTDYKYYASFAEIDKETAAVNFNVEQEYDVVGTFAVYNYLFTDGTSVVPQSYFDSSQIRTFALYNDDLVDYSAASCYIAPTGITPNKNAYYNFQNSEENYGKLSSNYTLNKDIGVLTFSNMNYDPPKGRIFADYYYHSFYRLTNDGYGDVVFYGNGVLVPAQETDSYKDWAYVDIKIINEGSIEIQNTVLKILARGYVSGDGGVDTVLDNNRPWDVQQGTLAETVNRCGGYVNTNYASLNTGASAATRANAIAAVNKQTINLGTIQPKGVTYVRLFWCIATGSASWIQVTRGNKTMSAELSGKYYVLTT